ncbi:MAG TPA: DUF368 domain-containing protein [Firmicutes bacterium]|jgi:putative membrane protein|nr:DUF368 domain-containing protein [Bacillota bacterium]
MERRERGLYKDFIKKILIGLAIGVAAITPGLSAGVIAAAAGLYEPVVHALVNFPKEYRKSIVFLFPLGFGAGIGVLVFSRVMERLISIAKFQVIYIFLGLVAGSIPALFKEANRRGFRKSFLWAVVIAFGLVLSTGSLLRSSPQQSLTGELDGATAVLGGAILAFGTIIPGISSSLILMYLGVYERLLAAFTGFDLYVLTIMAVGFGITALLLLKLVDLLFQRYRGFAYYGVMGFLLGSMVMIFPGFREGLPLILDLMLLMASAALSFALMRLKTKS